MAKNYPVASISGGQDSTAMLVRMLELETKIDHNHFSLFFKIILQIALFPV